MTQPLTRTFGPAALAGLMLTSMTLPVLAQSDADRYDDGPAYASSNYSGIDIPSSRHEIAAGTTVKVKLLQDISSATARVGDPVRAEVSGDGNGLPAGTYFTGRLTEVIPATPKQSGILRMQFGRGAGVASARIAAQAPQSDKSQYTGAGAGLGAIIGFARKRKLGDAIGGAVLGGAAGYGANQAQKRTASDVTLKKGQEITVKLDRPIVLRTQVVQPY